MPEFAQIVISGEQALMVRFALDEILRKAEDENDLEYEATEDEIANMKRLAVFFGLVAEHPNHFPVTGRYAASLKRLQRKVRGEARPASSSKRRADRHQHRRMVRRDVRRNRELIEQFNQAQQINEQEAAEAAEFWRETNERLEAQPTFNIVSPTGEVQVEGIPAELIQAADGSTPLYTPPAKPQIVIPGQLAIGE
jgi:hypothetical protein